MDSGLGVRWPLSPYATALAAGALFGFCFALWRNYPRSKHRSRKDLRGLNFGENLEPNKQQDVCEKSDQKKEEAKTERTRNFPLVTFGDLTTGFHYENLPLSGQFGAIPRIAQRNQPAEISHSYSVLRRRTAEKESKYLPEINPIASSFSCIYQKSFCFGNEIPRLNARFVLDVSPHLQPYINQFYQLRDLQLPNFRRNEFENFDVAINPKILKDKPITRSALCLSLERTLHRLLNGERIYETDFSERTLHSADFLREKNNICIVPSSENVDEQNLRSDFDHTRQSDAFVARGSDQFSGTVGAISSLWDSGYCEKSFDERCSTPRDMNVDVDREFIVECSSVFTTTSDASTTDFTIETSVEMSNNISDDVFIYSSKIQNNFNSSSTSKQKDETVEELDHSVIVSDDFKATEIHVSEKLEKDLVCEENINISFDSEILDQKLTHCITGDEIKASDEEVLKIDNLIYDSAKEDDLGCEEDRNISFHSKVLDKKLSPLSPDNEIHAEDEEVLKVKNLIYDSTANEGDLCCEKNINISLESKILDQKLGHPSPENEIHVGDEEVLKNSNLLYESAKKGDLGDSKLLDPKLSHSSADNEIHAKDGEVLKNINLFYKRAKEGDLGCEENINISFNSEVLDQKLSHSSTDNEIHDMGGEVLKNTNLFYERAKEGDLGCEDENINISFDSKILDQKLSHSSADNKIHATNGEVLKNINLFYESAKEGDLGCEDNINVSFNSEVLDQKVSHSSTGNEIDAEDEALKNGNLFPDSMKESDYMAFDTNTKNFQEGRNIKRNQIDSSDENILVDDSMSISVQSEEKFMENSAQINIRTSQDESLRSIDTSFDKLELEKIYETLSVVQNRNINNDNLSPDDENISTKEKISDLVTRAPEVDVGEGKDKTIKHSTMNLASSELESIQNKFEGGEKQQNDIALSPVLETEQSERSRPRVTSTAVPERDVIEEASSRDLGEFDEKGIFCTPRQMDRETGERSVAVESTVTTETTLRANGDTRLSTAVVSRLTLDDWSAVNKEDSVSVRTTVSEEVFRPTFEEFVPLKSSERIYKTEVHRSETFDELIQIGKRNGEEKKNALPEDELPSSPRVDRLKGLLNRDEERRSRSKFHHLADNSHVGGAMEGEWDRLLRDVLASVSELERWERQHRDVSSDAEDAEQQHHFSQSDSSFTMEEEALSPKGETPTKVKNLRFKLDPDVFDVPSDDSFYDDTDDDNRRGWKKQPKYKTFSTLELKDEPVRLVSVHASVVPAGQKLVARPVGIDLRVRLTEERQSKRAHVSTSPSQAKRRSPVSDRGIGWCQELSPVTENVDWRETFTPVTPECKSVLNGILKTPSPKVDPPPVESPNPFKLENGVTTNGVSPVIENKAVEKPKQNGLPWRPVEKKPFILPRKKFEPDPEAIERITGYKTALSKPPLPPPGFHKVNGSLITRANKAEIARKQYLDNKAALAASKIDGAKKFQQFLSQAQSDRAKIVTSVPDLVAIERAVTEQWIKERASVSPRESPARENNSKPDDITLSRGSTPDDKWASYVQSCRQHLGRRSQSMSYLETDIDIIPVLDEDDKCQSTSALDEPDEALPDPDESDVDRSREDLDDSGRAKSEHELRIERSLRSLPVPEWYRRSDKTKTGFLLSSSVKEKRGWAAAKSLASSTSSLASCGLRRPVRSLRSSRENIPWSRSSASPDGPTLSLALAKAFREPYLGWRARTPTSSGVSSSPRASPPSWGATTTDDEANGVSFDGEDAFGRTTSSEEDRRDEPLSLDDTGADAVTVSMDTNDPVKLPGGEDTCDDINNMSMDTCELFDASVVVPVDEDPSPQADTGDDIDNLSTDTTTTEGRKLDAKLKRYSYSQSIYHSEWDEEEESRGDRKGKEEERDPSPSSPDHKVVWIESSFVGSRTTTSIMVLPEKKAPGSTQERPASR